MKKKVLKKSKKLGSARTLSAAGGFAVR